MGKVLLFWPFSDGFGTWENNNTEFLEGKIASRHLLIRRQYVNIVLRLNLRDPESLEKK